MKRRDFIKVGALSLAGTQLNLGNAQETKEKSVISIFLHGGISHYESFVAIPTAIDKFRSVNEYVATKNGFYLGGLWTKLAEQSSLFSVVHNFGHGNAGHQGGTHWLNTGYNSLDESPGAQQNHPSIGSIVSKTYGTNTNTGMPTYVSTSKLHGQQASYLGSNYNPLSIDEEGKKNLALNIELDRFELRRSILQSIDRNFNDKLDLVVNGYKDQSYNILLGSVKSAFDIKLESETCRAMYGETPIGQQLLLARRLIQNGAKYVTVTNGSWDYHTEIKANMERHVPSVDQAIAALLNDLHVLGMLDHVMVVISTEFGRTPLNAGLDNGIQRAAGRDHQPLTSPLILAGGKKYGGSIIGATDKNGYAPIETPFAPIDLLNTILTFMEINPRMQYIDTSGRPRYLVESESRVIL